MIRIVSIGLAVVFVGLSVGCSSGDGGPRAKDAEVKGGAVDDKTGKKTKVMEATIEDPTAVKK